MSSFAAAAALNPHCRASRLPCQAFCLAHPVGIGRATSADVPRETPGTAGKMPALPGNADLARRRTSFFCHCIASRGRVATVWISATAIRRKTAVHSVGWIVLFLALAAARLAAGAAPAPALSAPARDLLVRRLYSPMERAADFEEAAATAAQAGVPEQTIAEARLAFCIRTRALDDGLPGVIEKLETMRSGLRWLKSDSRLFENPDELEGTLFFARALLAEAAGGEGEYERCMKEAFWWNPSAGALFGNALREHRERAALAAVTLPPDMALRDSGGSSVAIKDLLAGHKALLLEFWASWCAPCMSRMDELEARAQALAREGVGVAGVDVEGDPSLAGQVRLSHKITCSWLVEAAGKPLCQALKVQEIPHVVLLSPAGAVLFSGHPDDAGLRKALEAAGVRLGPTR